MGKKQASVALLSPAGSVEQKQGESGLIVRDHVSISRSDWTLGAVGKSLSLQIIKVVWFLHKYTNEELISSHQPLKMRKQIRSDPHFLGCLEKGHLQRKMSFTARKLASRANPSINCFSHAAHSIVFQVKDCSLCTLQSETPAMSLSLGSIEPH